MTVSKSAGYYVPQSYTRVISSYKWPQ